MLIAACDTFRAGAVEQLRTHMRKLNALHPAERHQGQTMVQLYEKGYGKDSAGIAMEAINYGKGQGHQLCLCVCVGGGGGGEIYTRGRQWCSCMRRGMERTRLVLQWRPSIMVRVKVISCKCVWGGGGRYIPGADNGTTV